MTKFEQQVYAAAYGSAFAANYLNTSCDPQQIAFRCANVARAAVHNLKVLRESGVALPEES